MHTEIEVEKPFGWRLWLPHILLFLFYGSGGSSMPFFGVFLQEQGLTGIQIGLIASMRPVVMLLAQPVGGVVADLWGRTRTLQITLFAAALVTVGYVFGYSFTFLAAWTVLTALVSNPIGPLLDSVSLDHIEREGKGSYGRLRMWGAVGWATGAMIVGATVAERNVRMVFVASGLVLLIGWLVSLCLPTEAPRSGAGAQGRNWRDATAVLRNRDLRTFLLLVVLMQLGAGSIFSFYPLYLEAIGASRTLIGTAYTFQGLAELPFYIGAAWIIHRLGSTATLTLAFNVFAVRALLYSVITKPWLGAAVEWLHGLSFSLFLVASVEFVNERVAREWRATGQSIFWVAYFGIGSIAGNLWGGFLFDRIGVQPMFRVNGLLVLAAAALTWRLLPQGRSGTSESPSQSEGR